MNLNAAIPLRSADAELRNTIEWQHTTATICRSKTGCRRQSGKMTILKRFFKGILKGKLSLPKLEKSAAKAPFRRFTVPFYCDLRLSAPKHNSITHAAAATVNLHAAIPMRSADTELRNTIEWQHTTVEHPL